MTRTDGAAEVIGYYPSIAGVGSSLFAGEPGEATARFTVRSSPVRLRTTIANALLQHTPIGAADGDAIRFSIYHDLTPNQDFANSDTFSDGQLIATFSLPRALVTHSSTSLAYIGTMTLEDAADFVFEGRRRNLGRLVDNITIHLSGTAPIVDNHSASITVPFGATVIAADHR